MFDLQWNANVIKEIVTYQQICELVECDRQAHLSFIFYTKSQESFFKPGDNWSNLCNQSQKNQGAMYIIWSTKSYKNIKDNNWVVSI